MTEQKPTAGDLGSNVGLGRLVELLRERRMLAVDGLISGRGRMHARMMWVTDEADPDCAKAADEIERLRGTRDVLARWMSEALPTLEVSEAVIESEDGGEHLRTLIDCGRRLVEQVLRPNA